MVIQKGVVKDAGFPDVECTYGTTDDGKIYYFIPGGKLANDNIIVSSNLKEAIGHSNHTSLGVIKTNGVVVLNTCHSRIIPLTKKILFIERNRPETPEVIGALSSKEDPTKVELLNTNKETIKNKITGIMGNGGKMLFANQFSEATIVDTDGRKLMDDKWYSFIGNKGTKLYFSTNLVDSNIDEYDFSESTMTASGGVVPEIVETPKEEVDEKVEEEKIDATVENPVSEEVLKEETPINNEIKIDVPVVDQKEEISEKIEEAIDVPKKDVLDIEDVDKANELREEERRLEEEREAFEKQKKELERKKYEKDSIIEDVRVTMKKLISQNVKQKSLISVKDAEIEVLSTEKDNLIEETNNQKNRIDTLEKEKEDLLNNKKELEDERDNLKETLDEKLVIIENQERELELLRPQIEGKAELPNLIKEAIEVLDDTENTEEIVEEKNDENTPGDNNDVVEGVKDEKFFDIKEESVDDNSNDDIFQKVKVA